MNFCREKARIFAKDGAGKVIAEVTFPSANGIAEIDHTFVDGSLRGQGVAGQLLSEAVSQIRADGLKARPTCTYAVKWFAEHPEQADLLTPTAP